MNTFGERLREVLDQANIRPSQIAVKTGKAKQTISSYLTNRTEPDFGFFIKLREVIPNISIDWLITGYGNMFTSKNNEIEDVRELKTRLSELQTREKQLTDTIIRMGTMIGGAGSQPGHQSKSKGVFLAGNFLHQHTVENTPWFA